MNSIDNQTLGIGLCITCFPNHFLVRLTRSGITWNLTSMHWIFEKTFNCVQKLSEPDQDQKVRVFHPFWIIFIGNPTHLRKQETHRLPQALVCAQELLEYMAMWIVNTHMMPGPSKIYSMIHLWYIYICRFERGMTSRPGPRDQARESARARRATEAELFKELEVLIFLSFCQFTYLVGHAITNSTHNAYQGIPLQTVQTMHILECGHLRLRL